MYIYRELKGQEEKSQASLKEVQAATKALADVETAKVTYI